MLSSDCKESRAPCSVLPSRFWHRTQEPSESCHTMNRLSTSHNDFFSPSEMCASGTCWFHLVTVLYMVSAAEKIRCLLFTDSRNTVCVYVWVKERNICWGTSLKYLCATLVHAPGLILCSLQHDDNLLYIEKYEEGRSYIKIFSWQY